MVANIIAHLLLNEAISAYSRKNAQIRMAQMVAEVERYYMTFFGEIFLLDERRWILNSKIKPLVSKMSSKELSNIIKIRNKNNKLVKQSKPIKNVLVDKKTIEQYHLEYQDIKRKERIQRENFAERKRRVAENEKGHKDYVYEFGESEAEIAKRFFG